MESTTNLTNDSWQVDTSVSHTVLNDDGTDQIIKIERGTTNAKQLIKSPYFIIYKSLLCCNL
jgi:hypothetical protein